MRVEWFCSCLLRFVPENSRPIRPNHPKPYLRVYCHGGCGLAKSKIVQSLCRDVANDFLYLVDDEKQTHAPHDVLSFLFRVVVDLRNVYFCQKIWNKIEETFALNMVRISKDGWNWEIEILHEGWIILFLFVIVCAWKFSSNLSQSPHPKHWHLRIYRHRGYGLAKSKIVQSLCRSTWQMIWKLNNGEKCGDRFSIPRWWKPTICDAQKRHG